MNASAVGSQLAEALQAFAENDQHLAVRIVAGLQWELEHEPALVARLGRALEALDEGDQLLAVGIVDDLRRELEPDPFTCRRYETRSAA